MPEHRDHTPRRGRPYGETAKSHDAIMEAVYDLLQEKSVRDLTLEEVAERAKVGRPTLYKWWPSKAALVLAMFQERIDCTADVPMAGTAEQTIRLRIKYLIQGFNGLFGKVMADLIAEGQSEPTVLRELYEQHIGLRRAATVAEVRRGIANGEFRSDTDPELLMDAIFGPIFFRRLLQYAPLTAQYGEEVVDQVMRGVRP